MLYHDLLENYSYNRREEFVIDFDKKIGFDKIDSGKIDSGKTDFGKIDSDKLFQPCILVFD